ncbi:MAG TPA: serine hydrolase domain-containing protein [Vicinamibacterales bacterium]|nr:serine hydrolase domain-containing protein [Vicinamibacterales bacterium]
MTSRTIRHLAGITALAAWTSAVAAIPAWAQAVAPAAPDAAGISAERLERVGAFLRGAVERGEIAGAVALVSREGRVVYLEAVGQRDIAKQQPMSPDTRFLVASMTKPVTSVAAMILVEEGRLLLSDPIAKFLPEFKDMGVMSRKPSAGTNGPLPSVPARRPITVRDLLTHRAGFVYGFAGDGPLQAAYRAAGIIDGLRDTEETQARNIARLAKLPLAHEPGTRWHYGLSTDVLGRVVEAVSGQPLDAFLRERVFEPLGMRDSAFYVPPEEADRVAVVYRPRDGGGLEPLREGDRVGQSTVERPAYRGSRKFLSGGSGLITTATDYARFAQMLLNGGMLDGVRILGPKTVRLMTVSHTGDLEPSPLGPGVGFGLGFSVLTDAGAAGSFASAGTFGWGGIFGTDFWVDPGERLTGVLMVQLIPHEPLRLRERFRTLVYQAIER